MLPKLAAYFRMENKKQNFKRIAESKNNKIINIIHLPGNLSTTSFYEYSDEQIEDVFDAIQKELDETMKIFEKEKGKKKRFEL